MRVLVTGATGYIGGRLVPRLVSAGHSVRVLARDPRRLARRRWAEQVEVSTGDLLELGTLSGVFDSVDAAYYLVHSMRGGKDYARRDRLAAENFCRAAAGRVGHVIYMGGLQPRRPPVSMHLGSRAEIGRILAHELPTTELRAGPIIGSGSASFELVRYLTERLPVIPAPRWVLNEIQPIAVRDVLSYLTASLDRGPSGIVEIGAESLTIKETLLTYARLRGLRRTVIALPPILPPWLGAGLVGALTPIPNALAVPLAEGIVRPLLVGSQRARELFPHIRPISYERAVLLALRRVRDRSVETRWSGAVASADVETYELSDVEGIIREVRTLHVNARPGHVYRAFSSLGGDHGWLAWNWAWRLRGLLDAVLGGPGLRRGRRDPFELLPGETVDFWRVELARPPQLLRLRAEVRMPGRGWLQWEAVPERQGTRLTQIASFAPRGLPGALYWYLLYPFHRLIFTDLIQAIGRRAGDTEQTEPGRGAVAV